VKTLAKTRLREIVTLKNYAVTWDLRRGPWFRKLVTQHIPGEHKFDTIAVVQLDGTEAKQLGLRTALGFITGMGKN
jgi:hypothetical protein